MYICLCNAITERDVRECARRGYGSLDELSVQLGVGQCDLKLEQLAHPVLKEGIAHCEAVGDYVWRKILEDILESDEEHIDWLETQLDLMQKVGVQNWLQTQSG
jgi:bacterioferritin